MPRDIHAIVDQQVRRWRLDQERRDSEARVERPRANVVTISNALGSNAIAIGQRVGARLEVAVYDHEILRHMAETAHVRVETIATLDEQGRNRLDDYLTAILHERNFDQNDFLKQLTRTVLALWEHGPCVLVGHGAVHLIPRRHALAVRTIAPQADRVRVVAARENLELAAARKVVQKADVEREAFHRRVFGRSIEDPINYDLILDTSGFAIDDAAAVVAEAYRRKFARAERPG